MYMYYLRILLTIINLGLFGVGSFLCFIVAVSQSLDRLLIGGIFLLTQLTRSTGYKHFTPKEHFGFEAASWYWHFVDVVWVCLFLFVYIL